MNKGWLSFLDAKNFKDFTNVYDTVSTQRISINPAYLRHRTETFLLKVLLALVENTETALAWWKTSKYKPETFKYRFRDDLASMIASILTDEESVVEYISYMRITQRDESAERGNIRDRLFSKME